ncbi:nuclear transport factor 2 family protein [Streptomyces sp. NPDC048506]|uniref:nuclear transport factor 2 family protein n=1 Tax=Streptomyces sp. NPDC048506 TaxID=3155028 RepID=UPI00343946D7
MSEPTALDTLRAALAAGSYEHRALTVVHRWYYGYETANRNLDHQRELVTEDFTLHRPPQSGQPDVHGRQAYLDFFAAMDPAQSNAHHLRSLAIEHTGPDAAQVAVTHDFETAGPAMNGSTLLRYDLKLVQHPAERLPRISVCDLQVLSRQDKPFTDALAENRVLAFVHYWCSLLEQPAASAEALRELLHPELAMALPDSRVLHTFDEVAAWYAQAGELVDVSTHHLIDPVITPGEDGDHRITVDFAWEGITRTGQPMTARTRHDWTLTDTGERYLRLKRFHVTALEPFTPVTAEEALAHHDAAQRPN